MAFILTIRERGDSWAGRGPATTSHPTRREAQAALLAYVRRNWDTEMDGEEPPSDGPELVERYFGNVLEAYDITEAAV
jgi:hypothetical protein